MANNKQEPKKGMTGSIHQWMDVRGKSKNGRHKQVPLPEGIGKARLTARQGYCPKQNGNIRWHEYYPLLPKKNRDRPSALADGRQYECQPFNQ